MLQFLLTLFGSIPELIAFLKSVGVELPDSITNEANKIIMATETDLANYEAGQAVPLANISVEGKPGYIIAVAAGGPAAASLGL